MANVTLSSRGSGQLPKEIWIGLGCFTFLGLFTENPILSVSAGMLLALMLFMLWREGEPMILLLVLGFQWLQVVMKVINANILGAQVSTLNFYGGDVEVAIWLSMAALAALTLGIGIVTRGIPLSDPEMTKEEAASFSIERLFFVYVVSVPLSLFIIGNAWLIPGGTQVALALAGARWAAYFSLAYICFSKRRRRALVLLAAVFELALGSSAYFSDFKTVFFVTIVAYLAAGRGITARKVGGTVAGMLVLLYFSLLWTAIKGDYRLYLSSGEQAQIVTQDYADRTKELLLRVAETTTDDLTAAIDTMAARIAYVDYFGLVVLTVPDQIPHENGALWGRAIEHIFKPRLFFPEKPELSNDSDVTNYYTGLSLASSTQGTSISMGYAADSYIDFGPYGMLIPIFALGLLVGWIYRYILSWQHIPIFLRYALVLMTFLDLYKFESPIVKLLGALVTTALVTYVLQKFVLDRLTSRLLDPGARQRTRVVPSS